MGTRAAAFNAKIQNLMEFHTRLVHGAMPPPSGYDIASTLKYFSQSLLGILKDIEAVPMEMLYDRKKDASRQALFPMLDYYHLFQALSQLVDAISLVHFGTEEMVEALIHTVCCLMPFADRELVDMTPYLISSMLTSVSDSLHQDIIDSLCYNFLPFTVGAPSLDGNENYAEASLPAILMMVFQYVESTSFHTQLLERLMGMRKTVIVDLFTVIAHGTPVARRAGANLLFHFWPNLNPTLFERRGFHIKFLDVSLVLKAMFNKSVVPSKSESVSQAEGTETKSIKGWKMFRCQLDEPEAEGHTAVVKLCLDHRVTLPLCPEQPPPLYVCTECGCTVINPEAGANLRNVLNPMPQVPTICDNKNCKSAEKNAVATCFTQDCTIYNGNKPIRFCALCHAEKHGKDQTKEHLVHDTMTNIWSSDQLTMNVVIEAIVSLLNEAHPLGDKIKGKEQERLRACLLEEESADCLTMDERRLMSRYGVWLLTCLCTPNESTPVHLLGRLLAALCHWFNTTQYLPDDQHGATIERLKSDYLQSWMQEIVKTHFEVFVSCLLPHPVDYAKVGGHWDTLASKSDHVKEGFRRFYCLVPYDVVTQPVWERVMPHWMEAIHNEVPEKDLHELKMTLSKLLDPEMSPLGFDTTQMYCFIAARFVCTNVFVQEQTLSWLQLLSSLSITIPIYQLIEMFQDGVKSLVKPQVEKDEESATVEPVEENFSDAEAPDHAENTKKSFDNSLADQSPPEKTLTCFILMFDVFYKQLEVQEIEKHKGVMGPVCIPFLTLMKEMMRHSCLAPHSCSEDKYCTKCDLTITYFQLTMDILHYLLPLLAIQNNRVADIIPREAKEKPEKAPKISPIQETPPNSAASQESKSTPDSTSSPHQIVTAQVDTVMHLDVVANMPQEKVLTANVTPVTLTAEDVASATVKIDSPSVVGVNDEPIDLTRQTSKDEQNAFWVTSQGKFKFKLDQLPPHLQVIYNIIMLLEKADDGDVVLYLCECLRAFILHGESFAQAANDHRGFLIYCQEHKNITLMWSLLEAEWSNVAEICVALLLHFLTLPCGTDIFWKLCENHFNHSDWKIRFQAVEKVVIIGRFLTVAAVKQCPRLQAALAHAFCFLLASLDDTHVAVSQRAQLYLTSLPDSGLRALCTCLEQQFDNVILDRPMIIQALHQLSSLLPDKRILSWEFFYNRFDTLYLEVQIALEQRGEIAFARDLRHTDVSSDILARKVSRAHDALTLMQNSSVKTLSSSLGTKWPYKRTMSAPANMFNKADKPERSAHRGEGDVGTRNVDDVSIVQQLQKAMDGGDTDFDTLHLLIFLLMHFMSYPEQGNIGEDKSSISVMNNVIRHLNVLMGYSLQEKGFAISPSRLRSSPVFNAFLSNLPKVLDNNFEMGKIMLSTCLPVLQFCPSPGRSCDLRYPSFSLWQLQPQPRRSWLISVLTILHKFNYNEYPLSSQILSLVRIALVTLEKHFHRCPKVIHSGVFANLTYSQEVSQGSFAAQDGLPGTPPQSPTAASASEIGGGANIEPSTSGVHESKNFASDLKSHLDKLAYDVESEKGLSAIPENPRLESQEGYMDTMSSSEETLSEKLIFKFDRKSEMMAINTPGGVTSVVASQIEAFNDTYKFHGTKLVTSKDEISEASYDDFSPASTDFEHSLPATSSEQSLDSETLLRFQLTSDSSEVTTRNRLESSRDSKVSGVSVTVEETFKKAKGFTPVLLTPITVKSDASFGFEAKNGISESRTEIWDSQTGILDPKTGISEDESGIPSEKSGKLDRKIGIIGKKRDSLEANVQHFSPQSPLSMMDLITLGSPVVIDEVDCVSGTVFQLPLPPPEKLELPTPERLLHVGEENLIDITTTDTYEESSKSGLTEEKLWQAFADWERKDTEGFLKELEGLEVTYEKREERLDRVEGQEVPEEPKIMEKTKEKDGLEESKTTLQIAERRKIGSKGEIENIYTGLKKRDKMDARTGQSFKEGPVTGQAISGSITGQRREKTEGKEAETFTNIHSPSFKSRLTPKASLKLEPLKHIIQSSTEDQSETSQAVQGSVSSEREVSSKSNRSSVKSSRCWDDIANQYFSWSEPNEGAKASAKWPQPPMPPSSSIKQSTLRVGEDCLAYRCMECGEVKEEFSNEDIGLCVIILSTVVHREPGLAAGLLPRMLRTVSRVASSEVFRWQHESPIHLPGSATSIGRQFLRCVLHQLAPNQIFKQIFQTDIQESNKLKFFKTLSQSLADFNELNQSAPIAMLLETLNSMKCLPTNNLGHIISNIAVYMECVAQDGTMGLIATLLPLFDTFLRKLLLNLESIKNDNLVKLLINVFRIQSVSSHKNILDPVSKLLSFAIQNSPIKLHQLSELCYMSSRIFQRERDKLLLPRLIVYELIQALKFKVVMPDTNLVILVQLLLQDCGGTLGTKITLEGLPSDVFDAQTHHYHTNVSECMRAHIHDLLEFITDVHTITKVKSSCQNTIGLNEDTLGGVIKVGVSQYLAVEFTRTNRDNRAIIKHLPWLQSALTSIQQGPKEYIETVVHIRQLSWLLLGSLTHTCLVGSNIESNYCQPIFPESSCHIADHIENILMGFPEYSKNTVQHMSSLYQTFILSQLWTLYLEQGSGSAYSEIHSSVCAILTDFWAKITPAILRLVSHSKVIGEMVALHLMSLMEALQECQSSMLAKLLPLWAPVLYTQHCKLPAQLLVRLRACQDATPPSMEKIASVDAFKPSTTSAPILARWLHRLQFKMSQIEMQSSAAIQFCPV